MCAWVPLKSTSQITVERIFLFPVVRSQKRENIISDLRLSAGLPLLLSLRCVSKISVEICLLLSFGLCMH